MMTPADHVRVICMIGLGLLIKPVMAEAQAINSFVPTTFTGSGGGHIGTTNECVTIETGNADSGCGRYVLNIMSGASMLGRAIEAHAIKRAGSAVNNTWALELGVHSQVAGNGATLNNGIYLASSHSGWLPSGVRNDTAILITGEDGWTNALAFYDTDGTTKLFRVDQYGSAFWGGLNPMLNFSAATGTPLMRSNTAGFTWQKHDGSANIAYLSDAGDFSANTLRMTSLPARQTGDKYVTVDASGNLHVSAIGPAS